MVPIPAGALLLSDPPSDKGAFPMAGYILEVTAKVIIRSDTDPDELPADIYAHISEFIHQEDDILDLDIEIFPLPADLNGGSPN